MVYSCAYFPNEESELEEAQQAKIDRLIEKAQLKESDTVLEIGCGWGAFAITAAKRIGCHVTGITLSQEQKTYAERRIAEEGLEDLVSIELRDYREVTGSFDKIVSIEMLEAVGHRYFASFFATLERVLKPNGLVALQVITFPDARYDSYRRGADWIQKYIFPGGICPSLTALSESMKSNSEFVVEELENIGVHYARTLEIWRQRFFEKTDRVKELGFDSRFIRIWEYYLCYCEAGFRTRTIGTLQLVLTRPKNDDLPNFEKIQND
ncbi:UNVERIFIED_CONTAM: hypothetical protein GTU68_022526 [Idotea baltica]|nr:hypothetical protein [Idotea baltica]